MNKWQRNLLEFEPEPDPLWLRIGYLVILAFLAVWTLYL